MVDDPLVREIFIEAPPEHVFGFLTDPAKYTQWMGIAAELDPRPGGVFRVDPNRTGIISGRFVEVVPHSKVVLTWGWETPGHRVPAGSSVVEFQLQAEGRGTRLRLVHRSLPPEALEGHGKGWTHYLSRLKTAAEGGDPGPDPLADPRVRHG